VIELVRLLRIERIDIGIAAIGEGAVLDDKRGETRRGVAKGAARTLDDAFRVFLAGVSGEEASALDRFELGADAELSPASTAGEAEKRWKSLLEALKNSGSAEKLPDEPATQSPKNPDELLPML